MAIRIEVGTKISDARASILKRHLEEAGFKIKNLHLVDVYTLDKKFSPKQLEKIGKMLTNPLTQEFKIGGGLSPREFSWAIEIGFLPGVTDNVANTVKEGIEDLLKIKFSPKEGVYSSQLIFLEGKLSQEKVFKLTKELINPLIQRVKIKNFFQFKKKGGMETIVPRVQLKGKFEVIKVNLNVDDRELLLIGREGIKGKEGRRGPLALDLTYMKAIQKYFQKRKREPTDIELETIAQTWSEHCKHTIFADPIDEIENGLFKTFIKGATEKIRKMKGKRDICVSVFTDNSGAISFDENWLITAKVETHNSPSALDPFGGAITGIVGVNRDTIGFGLGAKPIMNLYGFCFAEPTDKTILYRDKNLTQPMLSAKRIMEGVIRGVNVGGNCSGIPTNQGFLYFHKSYRGKPLVFVGTLGLIPRKKGRKLLYRKRAKPGDYIVMVGGRVGRDGIHGATFSSEPLTKGSPATAVQIGDPITQKKLSDALIKEARDQNLYHSITDNGAGGLSCSVAEMARESGGCLVDLEKVPLKYPGLAPWEIWISESQERMTLAVPPKKWKKFSTLMKNRGVEATIIGRFTNSGKCLVRYKGEKILDLDMNFLHEGLPPRPMKTTFSFKKYPEPIISPPKDLTLILKSLLQRPNIAGFEFVSSQYDHEVQGGSVIKPLQGKGRVNGEAVVIRPVLDSKKGVIVSQGINPSYSLIDTYHMASCAIDTAVRNIIASGGSLNKLTLLDNFCWCSSNNPERLGQLKRAVRACWDTAVGFGTPFISGKDSMFNDFLGYDEKGKEVKISVLPTLLITSVGIIDNIYRAVSLDPKFPGDLIYILGETFEELGGSEYFAYLGFIGNSVPKVNISKNKKLYLAVSRCTKKGLIASAIGVGKGGLGIALAKMAIAGGLGVEVSLKKLPGDFSKDDYCLFSESQGRIIVSINPCHKNKFEELIKGIPFALLGRIIPQKRIIITNKKEERIVDLDLNEAKKIYKSTFKDY